MIELKNRVKSLIKKLFSFGHLDRYKKIFAWKIFRKKIDRNQWCDREKWKIYNKLMSYSWEETKSNAYPYFKRLKFVVERIKGEILEIGCGIGNLTRWICKSEKVKRVIAIDAFREPLEILKSYNMPKVIPMQMRLEDIKFKNIRKFDTVIICEVIEHIYPEEEKKMLNALQLYVDSETIFIVSTPIGWMADPFHTRGFTKKQFKKHVKKYYGEPLEIDYCSGYSQIAYGYFNLNKN